MDIRVRHLSVTSLAAALLLFATLLVPGYADDGADRSPLEEPDPITFVRLRLDGVAAIDELHDAGIDTAHNFERVPDGVEIDAFVTDEQLAELRAQGVEVLPGGLTYLERQDAIAASADSAQLFALPFAAAAAEESDLPADTVKVGRVDYFTTKGQGFLSVEAKSSLGPNQNTNCNNPDPALVCLTVSWDTGVGTPLDSGGSQLMSLYHDSGVYMYHRILIPIDGPRPHRVQVTSRRGGSDVGYVSDWLHDVEPLTSRPGYKWNFIDGYKNPTQLFNRIEELAAQHPSVAEIVELPYETNGYQRKAQATIGSANASAVVVTSTAWGHEGGNDITVEFANPGTPSSPLSVEVNGNAIKVNLATDESGAVTSTAAQVAAALREGSNGLVYSHTYRGNAGNGVVAPTEPVALSDFLAAPAEIERGPFHMRAIRIGKHRDGSRPGVLIIAQDHAREWVPPVVALETVERLLANYETDAETARILEDVDIWVIPSNNPDGSHYSFFDRSAQRRNMTNYCDDANSDPGRRGNWGVDLNRNYRVGSGHDGYSGASFSCTSDTYQGPEKLSEPETKNIIALVEENPNIKFFMTIHSNGGQLFWQPGAYIAQGRITTPRPEMRDEAYYWQMADRILSHVKAHQDTVVRPDAVGGSADVLYSSAGNVREDLYNNYGIYAFGWEVGGSVWDPATRRWVGGSFQPNWEQRGHGETMEYANGVMEMFRIAAEFGHDDQPPTATLEPGGGTYNSTVEVRFETSEPATVYYTTDGSRPTLESPRYQAAGIREGGEILHVTETTTFKWFSVDPAGNIEGGYEPDGTDDGYREATLVIRDFEGARDQLDELVAAGGITEGLEAKVRHALEMAEAWIDLPRKQGPALAHLDRAIHLLLWQADVIENKDKPNQGDAAALRELAAKILEVRAASS